MARSVSSYPVLPCRLSRLQSVTISLVIGSSDNSNVRTLGTVWTGQSSASSILLTNTNFVTIQAWELHTSGRLAPPSMATPWSRRAIMV